MSYDAGLWEEVRAKREAMAWYLAKKNLEARDRLVSLAIRGIRDRNLAKEIAMRSKVIGALSPIVWRYEQSNPLGQVSA